MAKKLAAKAKLPSLSLRLGRVPSLMQWRQNAKLLSWAVQMLSSEEGRTLLAVLRDCSPSRHALPVGASDGDVQRAYGEGMGYEQAVQVLEKLAEPLVEPEELLETYEDPNSQS